MSLHDWELQKLLFFISSQQYYSLFFNAPIFKVKFDVTVKMFSSIQSERGITSIGLMLTWRRTNVDKNVSNKGGQRSTGGAKVDLNIY